MLEQSVELFKWLSSFVRCQKVKGKPLKSVRDLNYALRDRRGKTVGNEKREKEGKFERGLSELPAKRELTICLCLRCLCGRLDARTRRRPKAKGEKSRLQYVNSQNKYINKK